MRVTILALLAGLAGGLVGLAVRPRLRDIPLGPVRWPALLVVAVLVYRLPAWLSASGTVAVGAVLAAYAGLVAFAAVNLRLRGMIIVLVGLLCNAAVLVVNRAMPVDEEAVVAAGVARAEQIPRIDLEPPREWRTPEHRLVLLADVIPVAPLREVVSFGDLILAVGLANVVFRMLPSLVGPPQPDATLSTRDRRRRRSEPLPSSPSAHPEGEPFHGLHLLIAGGDEDDPGRGERGAAGTARGRSAEAQAPAGEEASVDDDPAGEGERKAADAGGPAG